MTDDSSPVEVMVVDEGEVNPTAANDQDSDSLESFHASTEIDDEGTDSAFTAAPKGYPSKKKVMVGSWNDMRSTNWVRM